MTNVQANYLLTSCWSSSFPVNDHYQAAPGSRQFCGFVALKGKNICNKLFPGLVYSFEIVLANMNWEED